MKIYLFVLLFALSVSTLAAQGVPDMGTKPAANAEPKVTVFLKNGDRLTGTFISGDAKTVKITYSGTELSFKLAEVRNLSFDTITGGPSFGTYTISPPSSNYPGAISGGVLNGKAVNLVKPDYPPAARAVGASGAVNVQIVIDEEGKVIVANAISGHPLLKQSAERAALASQFSPTTLSGQKVKITGIVIYNFAVMPPVMTVEPGVQPL